MWCSVFGKLEGRFFAALSLGILLFLLSVAPAMAMAQKAFAAQEENRLLSIKVEQDVDPPTVNIQTKYPVGYRYTVYDSFDPIRVVLDFPSMDVTGMDVAGLTTPIKAGQGPLKEIRVSSFDLTSGKLGRIEILLSEETEYQVLQSGSSFKVSFGSPPVVHEAPEVPKAEEAAKEMEAPTEAEVAEAPEEVVETEVSSAQVTPPSIPEAVSEEKEMPIEKPELDVVVAEPPPVVTAPAEVKQEPVSVKREIQPIEVQDGKVIFTAEKRIVRYKHFKLLSPLRLVVDIYGVQSVFEKQSYSIPSGFRKLRVGTYKDKVRFVFDAEGATLPSYSVSRKNRTLVVSWKDEGFVREARPVAVDKTVSVESVDFGVEGGKSILSVKLSAPAKVVEPVKKGKVVQFGVKNAAISRSLRRTIDSSAFPSAVRLITPYTVLDAETEDVRFAVELRGDVPFSLEKDGDTLSFIVDNGPYGEVVPLEKEKVSIPVIAPKVTEKPPVAPSAPPSAPVVEEEAEAVALAPVEAVEEEPKFVGEKISLVFDDADIRKILQLIGEVSQLNLIVDEEVKGTITLRLIDVPWDQALNLIMDIKGLGMLKEGNIARIIPKEKIRAMDQAKFTAARTKEKLEDLVTEVISVNYTDLANVSGPSNDLLTERGKITEDTRNKQIIVTDIPSVIEEVKRLIAILDTPERQVMIESRIVEADSTHSRDLGVKWGYTYSDPWGGSTLAVTDLSSGLGGSFVLSPAGISSGLDGGAAVGITFGQVGVDTSILDLRISALETAGHGKVVSTPKVTTLNGETAKIKQGTSIPYQVVSDDGPSTEFVDAVLSLEVTPVINPDGSVILTVKATNSRPGSDVSVGTGDAPSIDTKEAQTKVLVKDGETTVIGGIFVENESYSEVGVPLLKDIPLLGHLFKSQGTNNTRSELLIFITPRILE